MQLHINEEQKQIEQSVLDLLKSEYSFQQRAQSIASPDGVNQSVWRQFAELGWLGLNVSELGGGLGLGLLESGLLMSGLGHHLVIEPVWSSTMLAAQILQTCSPDRSDILQKLINGQGVAVLAYSGVTSIDSSRPDFEAIETPTGYALNGTLKICPGASSAQWLLIVANIRQNESNRPALFLLKRPAQGFELQTFRMLDGSVAASVTLSNVEASTNDLLSDDSNILLIINQAIARAMLLLCWEATGSMTAAFEQTRLYVGTRKQFGKALNEFQVVQHRLAEMAVLCREARAVCELGVTQAEDSSADVIDIAMRVKAKVGRCAQAISKDCVQLHGAMGVTEELPIASHFRKLLWFQAIWGIAEELDQRTGETRFLSVNAFQSAVLQPMPAIKISLYNELST